MEGKKQLIVVREGTDALGDHWSTIFSDYLQKLIRSFCDDYANPDVQMALVQFNAKDNNSPWLVQRARWVTNVNYFLKELAAIEYFGGGRFCYAAAITEGLSEVLTMCSPPNDDQTQQNSGFQTHCILVAASNPYPLPTQVYRPPDNSGTQSQSPFCDAETLVKSFSQHRVSLSVICPTQLPKLKSVYNMGKRNPSAADYTIDIVTNPHYLVLISEDFKSSLIDSSKLGLTTLASNHIPSNTARASVSGKPSTSSSTEWKLVPVQLYHTAPANVSSIAPIVGSATSFEAAQVAQSETSMNKRRKVAVLSNVPHASIVQSSDSGYVRLWEGDLECQRNNEIVFVTRLRAFRKLTDSTLLAEDWPSTMLFDAVMTQDNVNKQTVLAKKVYHLAFLATNAHEILEKLQQLNVCAYIRLPSQRLFLSVSDSLATWVGTLFPNDMVNLGPQTSGLQSPPSQQQSDATKKYKGMSYLLLD